MEQISKKYKRILPELLSRLGRKNSLAAPRLSKVLVSSGFGKNREPKRVEFIIDRLTKIAGQKATPRGAKKSIASFKVRQGDIVGALVTLRAGRMEGFLDKLLHVTIPRIRDFRGLDRKSVDEMGNLSIGLKEHTVFPEAADDELKDLFGLTVTVATTARNREEALILFQLLDFPFKRD